MKDVLWGVVTLVVGLLTILMLMSAEKASGEDTIDLVVEGRDATTVICFHNVSDDPNPPGLCYYYTKEDIPVPDFEFKAVVTVYTGKVSLTSILKDLHTISGRGEDETRD